jgi:hypothetical protein
MVMLIDVLQSVPLMYALFLEISSYNCTDCSWVSFTSFVYGLDGMVLVLPMELDRSEANINNLRAHEVWGRLI